MCGRCTLVHEATSISTDGDRNLANSLIAARVNYYPSSSNFPRSLALFVPVPLVFQGLPDRHHLPTDLVRKAEPKPLTSRCL